MVAKPAKLLTYLVAEIALFVFASLLHRGALVSGYEHGKAAVAETVIASVLAAGLLLSLMRPWSTRLFALFVQGFALAGTFLGVVMIAIGVGPRTAADLGLHALMIVMLTFGFIAAKRTADLSPT